MTSEERQKLEVLSRQLLGLRAGAHAQAAQADAMLLQLNSLLGPDGQQATEERQGGDPVANRQVFGRKDARDVAGE